MDTALCPSSRTVLLELTGQLLLEEDLASGQVTWSGALERVTGDPPEAFEGLGMETLEARIHPEDREKVLRARCAAMEACGRYEATFRFLQRDGTPRFMRLRGCYTGHDTSRASLHQAVLLDETALHQAECQHRELESQVLHCQKLETLGVLAGGIAHDFNNLLASVLGNLNLAQIKLPPESPATPHFEGMEKAILRATDLTRQLLAYSGRGERVVRPVHLNRVIEEIHHLVRVCISKRVSVRLQLADHLPTIEADATQIQQIILNLVTNASDALGDADGTIRIATTFLHVDEEQIRDFPGWPIKPGPYVALEVSDNGCGMQPEVLARIFDPFFSTKQSGRGLGLATTLTILRNHRGGLKVYSEPGLGTTFKLLFPATGPNIAPQPTKERKAHRGVVLLVDDELMILDTTAQAMEAMGFEVLRAEDGEEALKQVRIHGARLDLVLMDLTMPRMDGREAFRAIRAIRPSLPIVLSSGFNEAEVLSEFRGRGLAGFIQKPYLLKDLRGLLDRIMREQKPASSGAPEVSARDAGETAAPALR